MSITTAVVASYGLFTLVGGVIGYVKAKSFASLMAGVASGLFVLICAAGIARGSRSAAWAVVLVALSLGLRFFGAWRKNHRLMPDLLMVILSIVALLAVGMVLLSP